MKHKVLIEFEIETRSGADIDEEIRSILEDVAAEESPSERSEVTLEAVDEDDEN